MSALVSAWARGPRRLARERLLRPLTEDEASRVRLVSRRELSEALARANAVSVDNWARQLPRSGPYR